MLLENIIQFLLVLVVAIVIHEMSHAWVSNLLGDNTAKLYDRISFNPLQHIDLFMTVLLPLFLAIIGMPVFGGAKPVLVNKRKIKHGDYGVALVALAGPLSNLLLSLVSFGAMVLVNQNQSAWLMSTLALSVLINLNFFLFNILPVPPLDGSRLIYAFAPLKLQELMTKIERYGLVVIFILILLLDSLMSKYFTAGQKFFIDLYQTIFGVV